MRRANFAGGPLWIMDDAYNANPESMRAALAQLALARPQEGGRRLALLGEMSELGAESEALHAGLGQAAAEAGLAALFLAGPLTLPLKDALTRRAPSLPVFHEDEPAAIARRLQDFLAPHDVLLIKASRAAALEEVAALLVRDTHSDSATDAPGTPAAPGASSPEAA